MYLVTYFLVDSGASKAMMMVMISYNPDSKQLLCSIYCPRIPVQPLAVPYIMRCRKAYPVDCVWVQPLHAVDPIIERRSEIAANRVRYLKPFRG